MHAALSALAPSRWRRPGVVTLFLWCAAALYSAVVCAEVTPFVEPLYLFRGGTVTPANLVVAVLPVWVVVGCSAVLALPILAARRHTFTVLAAMLSEAALLVGLGYKAVSPFIAADVLIFFVVAAGSRRAMIAAGLSTPALWVGTAATLAVSTHDVPGLDASRVVDVMLLMTVAWISGFVIRQRRGYAGRLQEKTAEQAVTEERLRIARELHDMVAHSMGIIAIQAGAAKRCIRTQQEGAQAALGAIETNSREALAGLRHMLGALRQAEGENQLTPGLDDLERLVVNAADAGVRVELRWQGRRRPLSPEIDLSAYRIVQEALTNVVRHAGVTSCTVSIDHEADALAIEVLDEGRAGRGPGNETWNDVWLRAGIFAEAGFGLIGMRERVGLLHGDFSAGPRSEGGFRVAARLPLAAQTVGAGAR